MSKGSILVVEYSAEDTWFLKRILKATYLEVVVPFINEGSFTYYVPLVILSLSDRAVEKQIAYRKGANSYLEKPKSYTKLQKNSTTSSSILVRV